METKSNHPTPQRPYGNRLLDADIVPVNLAEQIEILKNESAYANNGKNALTVFKSGNITITLVALQAGKSFQHGKSDSVVVMSLQVLKGSLNFENQKDSHQLQPLQLLTLHQQLSFEVNALQDSICLLTLIK